MAHDLVGFARLFRLREIRLELQTLRRRMKARHTKHLRDMSDGGSAAMLFTGTHSCCPMQLNENHTHHFKGGSNG